MDANQRLDRLFWVAAAKCGTCTELTDEPKQTNSHVIFKLTICILAFVVAALPIALQDNLLLNDYPEHLAQFYITETLQQSAHLQDFYRKNPGNFPYWGIRAVVGALSPLVGLESAVRWFATFATLMPAAGCCVLGWTLARRITLLPLIGLLFVYNSVVNWGFLNYLFSGGVALLVFAGWIGSTGRPLHARLAGLAVAAICLIWMHPFAAVLLGLLVCLWEVADWLRCASGRKQSVQGLLQIVLAGAAFLPAGLSLLLLTNFNSSSQFVFGTDLAQRLWILMSPLWMTHSSANLIVTGLGVAVLFGLLLSGILKLRDNFGRLFTYLMLLAYLAPIGALGVFYIGVRIPVFAFMVLAAGLQPGANFGRWRLAVMPVFALLLTVRLYGAQTTLLEGSKIVSELRAASTVVPIGSKVLMAVDYEGFNKTAPGSARKVKSIDNYLNLDSYLITDREALVANIFGSVGLAYQDKYAKQVRRLGVPVAARMLYTPAAQWSEEERMYAGFAQNWRDDFDYLLLIDFGAATKPLDGTEQVHQGSYFELLKIGR